MVESVGMGVAPRRLGACIAVAAMGAAARSATLAMKHSTSENVALAFRGTMGRRLAFALAVMLALAVSLGSGPAAYGAADGFVLICNAKIATQALSRSEVRSLYTGKAKTLGGNAVVVVIRSDDDVPFTEFADQVFGVPTKTLLAKIKQEVFKGEMSKPVKAETDDEVVRYVSGSTGTIGVVSSQAASHLPKTVIAVAIGG
jgi:hypothetical protein